MLRTKYSNQPDKIKELSLKSVLVVVYWWPDLSKQSIKEMRALAMRHNIKGECSVSMTFWDKMKFICDELTHKPKAVVSKTMDSTSQMVPVHKWTQALKEEVMHKLSKHNIQSLDPLFQLAPVCQDIWDLVLELSHPVKTVKGRSHKLKPLTSITTFQLLASLSNNEKLQLLSALYNELKVCKQVEAAFVADAGMPVMEITRLLGEDIYHKEVECWTNAFS